MGLTPLHWACDKGNNDAVTLFLKHGADIQASSDEGETALSYALDGGHDEIAALLRR